MDTILGSLVISYQQGLVIHWSRGHKSLLEKLKAMHLHFHEAYGH